MGVARFYGFPVCGFPWALWPWFGGGRSLTCFAREKSLIILRNQNSKIIFEILFFGFDFFIFSGLEKKDFRKILGDFIGEVWRFVQVKTSGNVPGCSWGFLGVSHEVCP